MLNTYLAMMEVLRKHSDPGTVSLEPRTGGKGQPPTTGNLDWAINASKYLDGLSFKHKASMERVFWDNDPVTCNCHTCPPSCTRVKILQWADEGLSGWYRSLPDKLLTQAEKVEGRVL